MTTAGQAERAKLERSAKLHWAHWLVVVLSLLLTLSAWQISKRQVDQRIKVQFDRESAQVIELVRERMQKYEVALWSGVGLFHAEQGDVEYQEWLAFAESIRIDLMYPGIDGIGVIEYISPEELPEYLADQHDERPDFAIYPPHDKDYFLPITYIEPVASNFRAVGLDMAHERNRLTAAIAARSTGEATITGPIVLVQDELQTPGFLFFAPYYRGSKHPDPDARTETFEGLVYAPFVVHRLMAGVLDKDQRRVGIRLHDGAEEIYDELVATDPDFDPEPLLTRSVSVPMYGRTWNFDIWSSRSFRSANRSSQPLAILGAGILIDAMLIALFVVLSRTSRRALRLADLATQELNERNGELEQFVYTASHDLKSPIVTILGYVRHLQRDIEANRTDELGDYGLRIGRAAENMRHHVDDLLELSRIGRTAQHVTAIELSALVEVIWESVAPDAEERGLTLVRSFEHRTIEMDMTQANQVIQNLLGNAVRYGCPDGSGTIEIGTARARRGMVALFVRDHGPGVEPQYRERVFGLFERLTNDKRGTGIGLSIVRRVAEVNRGKVWIEETPGGGATFWVSLPAGVGKQVPSHPKSETSHARSRPNESPRPVPARRG